MSGAPPAILVVDDNEDNRFMLTERLKREGYDEVAVAEDGHHALDMLVERPFDLVLLDVMMPDMNGFEVLERIKSDTRLRNIPVIMISAADETENVIRCIDLGAEDYLPKPFNKSLLRARVGACLEKKKLRDQEAAYLERISAERKRADELLHAMLPHDIVMELKSTNAVKPRRYENVAVLFCDVVEFTRYCDAHDPEEVVSRLQTLIDALEDVTARNGLEKIKTVGDAFMATAGLIGHVDQPALAGVQCGLEMVAATERLGNGWQVRVGVHAGPVVAGVIGRQHYMYDLWGDTVNVATRIAEAAEPGGVVVTGETWIALGNRFRGTSRGFVDLKGKGSVELIQCQAD
ncbi:MAG: adenylate/guanylate cyclase domain-containing protein [Alphaproteobacteria bacterium]|nr:adenylate/guanylate cyclase domain-containing protein [Alphaproteobacteria bacterium]